MQRLPRKQWLDLKAKRKGLKAQTLTAMRQQQIFVLQKVQRRFNEYHFKDFINDQIKNYRGAGFEGKALAGVMVLDINDYIISRLQLPELEKKRLRFLTAHATRISNAKLALREGGRLDRRSIIRIVKKLYQQARLDAIEKGIQNTSKVINTLII